VLSAACRSLQPSDVEQAGISRRIIQRRQGIAAYERERIGVESTQRIDARERIDS